MDIDNLVAHSRVRFDHSVAKRTLKEKYENRLIFAYAGGMFRADHELINTVKSVPNISEMVIQDMYGNPVKINTYELSNIAIDLWQSTMQQWLVEYQELNKKR